MMSFFIVLQHGQRVTGMDWAAKSNQLVTCAAVSVLHIIAHPFPSFFLVTGVGAGGKCAKSRTKVLPHCSLSAVVRTVMRMCGRTTAANGSLHS